MGYLVGEHKDINIKPIRILKHGRKAKSLVKYGLEEISTILLRPTYTPKFDVFKFLSCRTFVRLNVLNNFNFKFQDIQAWNKADVMLVDSIKYDRSPCFYI